MTFDLFLSSTDAARVSRVLEKLAFYGIDEFALTGGLAVEIHLARPGHISSPRTLNDIDFAVESLASIPGTLAKTFLIGHIHPRAPEGKTLLQLVDSEEALRIDIFRAYGTTMKRNRSLSFTTIPMKVVSAEDLAARAASLIMDLEKGLAVPRKHALDFQRLMDAIELQNIELAWQNYRKPSHPVTFKETSARIRDLVHSHADLLIVPDYSHDPDTVCPKCEETGRFRLASAQKIMSILGYC